MKNKNALFSIKLKKQIDKYKDKSPIEYLISEAENPLKFK